MLIVKSVFNKRARKCVFQRLEDTNIIREGFYEEIKNKEWRKSIYLNELGLKSKKCSKCKEELPATPEFYSDLDRTSDGFHSQCRKCKS